MARRRRSWPPTRADGDPPDAVLNFGGVGLRRYDGCWYARNRDGAWRPAGWLLPDLTVDLVLTELHAHIGVPPAREPTIIDGEPQRLF